MPFEQVTLEKPLAWIVIAPDADADFFLSGVYDNREAALKCAHSTEYTGRIYPIRPADIESTFVFEEEEE